MVHGEAVRTFQDLVVARRAVEVAHAGKNFKNHALVRRDTVVQREHENVEGGRVAQDRFDTALQARQHTTAGMD